jgi:hypothetical protein
MVIDTQTLKDVIGVLSARAEFDSDDQIRLNLRVALGKDKTEKKWYYDLTNRNWEFIEMTADGWKIVNNLILFHRYNNQLPQVYPSREYSSDIMNKFLNLILGASVDKNKLDAYKILLSCYIICAFIPDIPKTVPMTFGHQGAAKTSIMEFIKMLIDPSAIKTLSFPTDINELIQQLSHNYLAFYDNISTLTDRTSDQLCRAVTGSGSSKRVLYSDDGDFVRSFRRCIGLNGINLAATKPDLLDRAVFFELKRIENKDRRKIDDIWKEFEQIKPTLLGYIFDILVKALAWKKTHKKIDLELPRMADWAEWCEVISRCMGNKEGVFLKAFENNRKIQIEQIIESSQVGTCLTHYIDTHPDIFDNLSADGNWEWGFEGTASKLLEILHPIAPQIGVDTRNQWWPKAPNALSRRLNEIAHTLREAGIEVEFVKSPDRNRVRTIRIRKISSKSSIPSDKESQPNVPAEINRNKNGRSDGSDDNLDNNKDTRINPSQQIFDTSTNTYDRKLQLEQKNNLNTKTRNSSEPAAKVNVPIKTNTEEKNYLLESMLNEIEAAKYSIVSVPNILQTIWQSNELVQNYLGDKLTPKENPKVRELYRDINRHKNIDPVKRKPQFLVKWRLFERNSSDGGAIQ